MKIHMVHTRETHCSKCGGDRDEHPVTLRKLLEKHGYSVMERDGFKPHEFRLCLVRLAGGTCGFTREYEYGTPIDIHGQLLK